MDLASSKTKLSREQKTGFVLLLVFSILVISLGVLQIRNSIYQSFSLNNKVPLDIGENLNTVESLKYRDTDLDNLSDFDELNLYNTSPYLEDTDSDGLSDGQEVLAGKNPLCAEGDNCENEYEVGGDNQDLIDNNPLMNTANAVPPSINIGGVEYSGDELNLGLILENPDSVRQLLIESGIDQNLLNQLSDEDLMQATAGFRATNEEAQKMQAELIQNYNNTTNNEQSESLSAENDLENNVGTNLNNQSNNDIGINESSFDVDYIRNLLLQGGIPQEYLDQISDEDIIKQFNDLQTSN